MSSCVNDPNLNRELDLGQFHLSFLHPMNDPLSDKIDDKLQWSRVCGIWDRWYQYWQFSREWEQRAALLIKEVEPPVKALTPVVFVPITMIFGVGFLLASISFFCEFRMKKKPQH